MTHDILDLIDSTLDDYSVSADAMRWAPDAPDPTPGGLRSTSPHSCGPDCCSRLYRAELRRSAVKVWRSRGGR